MTYCKGNSNWIYAAAVGHINYLSGNSWLDTNLSVNQVAHHNHNPKLSHYITIKSIRNYL